MNTIGVAFAYAVLALFAQNAIFTRGCLLYTSPSPRDTR